MRSLSTVLKGSTKPTINIDKVEYFSSTNTSYELDKLIGTSSRNCHPVFGGNWSVNTYKKKDGTHYTKHSINCMKCNSIQSNLYTRKEIYQQTQNIKLSDSKQKDKTPYSKSALLKACHHMQEQTSNMNGMRLTRHGFNISPTKSSNSKSETTLMSYSEKIGQDYKMTHSYEKNDSGQMSFKTHKKRKSGTTFYKKS